MSIEQLRDVHLLKFVSTLRALEQAWHSQRGGAHPVGSVAPHLRACCIQCGITLTPEELEWLIKDEADRATGPNPRLKRIQQGYCARRTCDSYFYELSLTGPPAAEAESLWTAVSQSVAPLGLTDDSEPPRRPWIQGLASHYNKGELLVAAGTLVVLIFLSWWHFRTPSWAQPPTGAEYQADPQSLQRILVP